MTQFTKLIYIILLFHLKHKTIHRVVLRRIMHLTSYRKKKKSKSDWALNICKIPFLREMRASGAQAICRRKGLKADN
jgi:hypothetical protein